MLVLEVIVAVLTQEGADDGAIVFKRSRREGASLLQCTEAMVVEVSPRTDIDSGEVLHAVQQIERAELHLIVHTCLHRVRCRRDDRCLRRSTEVALLTECLLGDLGA